MFYKFYLIGIFISALHADITQDLGNFFNRMGYATNATQGSSFQDQAAGYYTGGSFISRLQPRSIQIGSLQLPTYKAGCGGIDLFMGGFSHIKSQELIQALRGIGSAMGSYAFMLGLQTISPQIYTILNELNALATKINGMNLQSCETAATMLGGVWPKSDMASNHLCKAMGSSLGTFSDYAQARQGCGAQGRRDGVLGGRNQHDAFKKMLVGDYNLAWKALQESAFLRADAQTAHLFMTLSGTLVASAQSVHTYPSKANQDTLLNSLLDGGTAILYTCQDAECLKVTEKSVTIPDGKGFRTRVSTMLDTLSTKIITDEALTAEEKGFLNTTALPVYKILNVMTAFRKGGGAIDIREYTDVIALDILYTYLTEVFDLMAANVTHLKAAQLHQEHLETFQRGIREARTAIVNKRKDVFQHLQTLLSLIQKSQLLEKHVHSSFTLVNNASS